MKKRQKPKANNKMQKSPFTRRRLLYIFIIFVLSYAAASAVLRYNANSNITSNTTQEPAYTVAQARQISELFLRASPTYSYDGNFLEFKAAHTCENKMTHEVRRAISCFSLNYKFVSSHIGYGNRSNQTLAQVITPHDADIVVEKGEIKSAIIDGNWDELAQKARLD